MKKFASVLIFSIFALSACTNSPYVNRQEVGAVAGGVAGGFAGSALTGGSTLGTIGGTLGGAVIGAGVARNIQ